jgi:diguanylate cyclase (GGDEF)-like protein/PAS domain S-box-containing protein
MQSGDTLSNVILPITVNGTFWGQLGVDDVQNTRLWTPVEIEALRTFADVIGALLTREHTEAALQKSELLFRTVSESVIDGVITVGVDDRIRYWNKAAEQMFGYSAIEAQGKHLHDLIAPDRYHTLAGQAMQRFAATGEGDILGKTREVTALHKDGSEFDIEMAINAMTVGTERLAVGVVRDITERKRSQANVLWLARNDLLTGLSNRAVFVEALNNAIAQAKRGSRGFAVLYLDLDHFKDINDTLGHPAGDLLLSAVAERLRTSVRSVDTVARFGGDEFAVIALDIRDSQEAGTLAEKLVTEIGRPFETAASELRTGVSIGIAVYGPDSLDAESLLSHADVALYRAKAEGRGGFAFFTEAMDKAVRDRVMLGRELRNAVTANQFFLEYQPQVDGPTRRFVGVEALIRWRHPTRGILPPSTFIPAVERIGLISILGRWVMREACRQMALWIGAGIAPPIMAINLSALQFKPQDNLERDIAKISADAGVPANSIELELTESALMEVSNLQGDVLMRLHEAGFRIAIDDFGNGYSSLDYLRRFRVDRIKIPQNFIADLGVKSTNAPIVRATISLAHELGITVVAEGVETAKQLALLSGWGCHEIQGFYFSRSLSAGDVTALLRLGRVAPALTVSPPIGTHRAHRGA